MAYKDLNKKLANDRAFRAANRERLLEYKRGWRAANPDKAWAHGLWVAHKLRPEQWAQMFADQAGSCCYCERPLPADTRLVHIDHDHTCCEPKKSCASCRRGLACHWCNAVVGQAGDDPDRLIVIAANLQRLATEARCRITQKPVQAELPIDMRFPDRAQGAAG